MCFLPTLFMFPINSFVVNAQVYRDSFAFPRALCPSTSVRVACMDGG